MGPFVITWCFTNGTVKLLYGATTIRYNIPCIHPYKYDTNIEDIKPENIHGDVNILWTGVYFYIILNLGHKVYNHIHTGALSVD